MLPPRRSWCGARCVDLWQLATTPQVARRHLASFFDGCWACLAPMWSGDAWSGVSLEVDHVRPLWSLSGAERLELRWWLPFNLQLLCEPCHKAKSRREAAERAALRSNA